MSATGGSATDPSPVEVGEETEDPGVPLVLRGLARIVHLPAFRTSGVYFLTHRGKVVYVGQSVNILARVTEHVGAKPFTRAHYIPVRREDLNAVEGAFIRLFRPRLNTGSPIGPSAEGDEAVLKRYGWRETPRTPPKRRPVVVVDGPLTFNEASILCGQADIEPNPYPMPEDDGDNGESWYEALVSLQGRGLVRGTRIVTPSGRAMLDAYAPGWRRLPSYIAAAEAERSVREYKRERRRK